MFFGYSCMYSTKSGDITQPYDVCPIRVFHIIDSVFLKDINVPILL
jgi:hypothetical protein